MKNLTNLEQTSTEIAEKPESKPQEEGGVVFSSSIRIFDPNTKEILVHQRGDD
jgi:hypothetical protein